MAVLGPRGTFSYAAFLVLNEQAGSCFGPVETRDNLSTILTLVNGEAGYALVPVSNNVTGAVSETLGFLAQMAFPSDVRRSGHPFSVVGELAYPVCHSLVGWKGDSLEDVRDVYSHPQALAQCFGWVSVNLPQAALHTTPTTVAGASEITMSGIAAIAQPDILGENCTVLAEGIHPEGNATRFLIVAQRGLGLPIEAKVDRATFVVAIRDEPGSLLRVLNHLADCQLTEIFSIPKPDNHGRGERIFWVDLQFDTMVNLPQLEYDLRRSAADCLINLGVYPAITV